MREALARLATHLGLESTSAEDHAGVLELLAARGPGTVALIDGDREHALDSALALTNRQVPVPVVVMTRSPQIWQERAKVVLLVKPIRTTRLAEAVAQVQGHRSSPRATSPGFGMPPARRNQTVLVVEDNPTNQRVAVAMLDRLGFDTATAANGADALAALERAHGTKSSYALVLMDCQMPVMDGYTATSEWRARERDGRASGHLPIVALTAKAMKGDRERCLDAGASDYLAKPVNSEQLLATLRTWLHR